MRTVLFAFKCHAEFLFWRCFLNGLRFSLSRRPGGARDAFTKRAVEETDPPVEDLFHLEMKFETYLSLFLCFAFFSGLVGLFSEVFFAPEALSKSSVISHDATSIRPNKEVNHGET